MAGVRGSMTAQGDRGARDQVAPNVLPKHRGQLLTASALFGLWLLFLAWMAINS